MVLINAMRQTTPKSVEQTTPKSVEQRIQGQLTPLKNAFFNTI